MRTPALGLAPLLLTLLSALHAGCSVDAAAGVEFQADIEYGRVDGEPLRLNLALPMGATGRLPAIVVIHGGAWRQGDRSDHDDLARSLAEQGYVAATIGYRFCPQHRFPAQVQDALCAVRYLRANAERYHVDADRIGAVGFSAGAHVAMMLGTLDAEAGFASTGGSVGPSSKVQAVVAYFGPTDFELPLTDGARPLIVDFLGGTLADKTADYRNASPVNHLSAGDAPMLLFQGTLDPLVPPAHATRMAEAMSRAGVSGRVELLVGQGHGDWDAAEYGRTAAAMTAFFGEHLGAAPAADQDPARSGR